ncbi:MAG TPA: IncP-type conjugal transfer protein TraG [Polyangiaceae bacterium]|nr:IncP-type conjugal transfer protein TraG [Polyangiaceae bacterium]
MRALALLILLLLSLAGLWLSTEYVAVHLHYASGLGAPWITLGSLKLYAPWGWLAWTEVYEGRAPTLFRDASGITTLGALAGCVATALAAACRKPAAPSRSHGSSRWATTAEVKKAGLLRDGGVVLGQTNDAVFESTVDERGATQIAFRKAGRLIRHDGPEHVFCFAPTRSGKGVGLVVPTLLSWPHSVLVYDIKKENWALTAGWRRQFSRVWRFEPTAIDSLRFNPLMEIRKGLNEVRDVQNVADILVDPTGEKDTRDHWQTTAHSLLTGAILHVLYAENDKTLSGVARFLSNPAATQAQTLERMLRTPHLGDGPHPAVAEVAREMMSKSERELSGVLSTAMACLGLYRDPVVARNTEASDFRIADLMNADAPVSLYLVVPPSDLARTRPIIRLILNQIGRRLTESMQAGPKTAYKHRLLLLLDEFPSLGRLEFFESALAFMAGYGLKALLIAQSLNQLEKTYGPNNSILDNCHIRVAYAANDDRTAKRISDLLGQATEKKVQRSYSGSGLFLGNRTESEQEFGRPLLTPAEVNQLPQDDGILLVGGLLPYRARKVRYFVDPRFRGRDALSPPDCPAEQAQERLTQVAREWDALAITSSREAASLKALNTSAPSRSKADGDIAKNVAPSRGQVPPDEARSGAVEDAWEAFFDNEAPSASTATPGRTDGECER